MDLGLKDRVFVVTAASAGLGGGAAQALAAEGAKLVLVARRPDKLAAAAAALGENAIPLAADLAAPGTADAAAALALDRFGRLDGAFVSAGGPPKGSALGNSDDEWRAAFESVFLTALRVTRAVLERAENPVRLGYVLSTSVKAPIPGLAISNGLRPGLAMWIKQLANEIGPQGSRAIGLMPGTILTDRIMTVYDTPEKQVENARSIPLQRFGEPLEFGHVAAFCLSDAASYLNGCILAVDGGMLQAL